MSDKKEGLRLFYLIYASAAVKLIYKDGNFIQVLEGEEPVVRKLFEKIWRDARHKLVSIIHAGSLDERQFPDWSMGFRDLNAPDVRSVPGYSEFLNKSFIGREFTTNPSIC